MTPTFRSTGNSRSHIVAPGYQRTPRVTGKLLPMERHDGEPSLWAGAALLVGLAIVATLLIVAVAA